MAKQFNQSDPRAWIVSPKDRGRKSIKNGKVFLKNNEEFEIEIFNPLNITVLADIKLNKQSISKTGLIIRPGQRVYLDCFIDDKRKFIFKTYEVENSTEALNAISDNGILEVFFYRENVVNYNNWQNWGSYINIYNYPTTTNPYRSNPYTIYCSGSDTNTIYRGTTTGTTLMNSINNSSYTISCDLSSCKNTETGRVEKGNKSNQKFTEVNMDFENFYISSTIIHILPESRKPAEVKAPKKEINDNLDLIEKLHGLLKSGAISDEEFNKIKTEILSRI